MKIVSPLVLIVVLSTNGIGQSPPDLGWRECAIRFHSSDDASYALLADTLYCHFPARDILSHEKLVKYHIGWSTRNLMRFVVSESDFVGFFRVGDYIKLRTIKLGGTEFSDSLVIDGVTHLSHYPDFDVHYDKGSEAILLLVQKLQIPGSESQKLLFKISLPQIAISSVDTIDLTGRISDLIGSMTYLGKIVSARSVALWQTVTDRGRGNFLYYDIASKRLMSFFNAYETAYFDYDRYSANFILILSTGNVYHISPDILVPVFVGKLPASNSFRTRAIVYAVSADEHQVSVFDDEFVHRLTITLDQKISCFELMEKGVLLVTSQGIYVYRFDNAETRLVSMAPERFEINGDWLYFCREGKFNKTKLF